MSLSDLIIELNSAQTPDQEAAAYSRFNARKAVEPTWGEVATAALRECVSLDGKPMLGAGEYADVESGKLVVRQLN